MDEQHQSAWRVLIADDDEDSRLLLAAWFRRAGFEVAEAVNGEELLDSFAKDTQGRTIVVSDIGMPVLDGIAATTAVRRASTRTPILLVTAFGDERTLRSARDAGADRVFVKPLDLASLLRATMQLIAAGS